ncbi:hypothetical protein GF322_04725 [Candidatus Dependentiae bacterium]|nr:hypothetical protein [Candidatus Dependentiae bacterium]
MKKWRITGIFRNKKNIQTIEEENPQHKKFKYPKIKKLKRLATKIKHSLKAYFPKRIWPKPQKNRKGPKV